MKNKSNLCSIFIMMRFIFVMMRMYVLDNCNTKKILNHEKEIGNNVKMVFPFFFLNKRKYRRFDEINSWKCIIQGSGETKLSVIPQVQRNVTRVIQRAHNIIQHSSSSRFEKWTLPDNNPCTKRKRVPVWTVTKSWISRDKWKDKRTNCGIE